MTEAAKGSQKALALTAVYIISLLTQGMQSISLILHGVSIAYPDTSVVVIQMILSVVNLFGIVGMLIAGKLSNVTTKKTVLIVFLMLVFAGGLVGYFAAFNLVMVFVAAALIGIGNGALVPLGMALIAEFFADEDGKRATAMGIQGLFVNGGGVLLNLVGGILASIFWKDLFFIYFIALPFALVAIFMLPQGGVEKTENHDEKVKMFSPFLLIFMLQGFFVGLVMMTLMANVAMYVFELSLGNEAQAGIITMVFAGASVLVGIFMKQLMNLFGRYHWAIACICGTVGIWLFAFTQNLTAFIIAGALIGICFTLHNTAYFTVAPMNVHPARVTMSISMYTVALNVGMILCPIIITPLAGAFGEGIALRFVVVGVIMIAVTIFSFISPRLLDKYKLTIK